MGACNRKPILHKQDSIHKIQYELLLCTDGYDKIPIVTLEKAIIPLIPLLPAIQTYVCLVKEKCMDPADQLTCDESASIMLYSIGWQPLNECLYVVLNTTLQSINRHNLKPWFLYLKLIFTAVVRLPSLHLTVYRKSKSDLTKQYEINEIITWWDFSLCTTSIEHVPSETKTIFKIECSTVKDIRKHVYFESDDSLLILPGTQFIVVEYLEQDNNLHIITLKEIHSSFLLQTQNANIKSTQRCRKFWPCQKQSRTLSISPKSSISNSYYRNMSLEQTIFESGRGWTIDLDEQNVTDRDIKIIVKHAIIKNRCRRIRLRDNNITSLGALALAEGLKNNITLESLDLRNNYISDLGVQYLASSVINSNLKTLNLESNGITTEGAEYLAQILKNNQSLTELYLSKNHLGDQGVELLANVLSDSEDKKHHHDQENKGACTIKLSNLQHLYLGHNDITDIGVEHLANMLKTNRMLTWLWLSGNEIGNQGVELLADTLAYHNSSLEWLFLNSNKNISDASADALVHMLKRNHSLKTIYINNCNLSDIAKKRIQEMTKSKKDFDLEV